MPPSSELAGILGEPVGGDEVIRYSSNRDDRHRYGYVQVSKGRVKMDLSGLPVAAAREICRLLREIEGDVV